MPTDREDSADEPGLESTGHRSGRVRIVGAEQAGQSAAARPADDGDVEVFDLSEEAGGAPIAHTPLPHWTAPPTGEVPAILSRGLDDDIDGNDPWASLPAPNWKEGKADWKAEQDEYEPSMLAETETRLGSLDDSGESDRQPWAFDLPSAGPSWGGEATAVLSADEDDWADEPVDWSPVPQAQIPAIEHSNDPLTEVIPAVGSARPGSFPEVELDPTGEVERPAPRLSVPEIDEADLMTEPRPSAPRRSPGEGRRFGRRSAAPNPAGASAPTPPPAVPLGTPPQIISSRPIPATPPAARSGTAPREADFGGDGASRRNVPVAIATGLVLGVLVLVAFKVGPPAAVGLVTVVVTLAAAEAFAAFRHEGYHPVTLLGLVATVSVMVATYNKGEAALPLIVILLFAFSLVWYLAGVERGDAVRGTATTMFVFCWVGAFGSFGALLLSPALFPERHGIAFMWGAIIAAVAYDVGALAIGSWLGRHPLAPSVSPNKTWEGFFGGAVTCIVVTVVIVHFIHPWTVGKAAALGLTVAIVSPVGDLCESLVKRQLGRKDMGRLLPGHGGLLDRVDGLLFVLPATFYLVKALHLG
jgi:CDP-diglyceride synthetase